MGDEDRLKEIRKRIQESGAKNPEGYVPKLLDGYSNFTWDDDFGDFVQWDNDLEEFVRVENPEAKSFMFAHYAHYAHKDICYLLDRIEKMQTQIQELETGDAVLASLLCRLTETREDLKKENKHLRRELKAATLDATLEAVVEQIKESKPIKISDDAKKVIFKY